jgi:hypothetical protein
VSRLSGNYPRRPATQANPDNLARMSTTMITSLVARDCHAEFTSNPLSPPTDATDGVLFQ